METAKAKDERPTQSEIAAALGISAGRVSQLKALGLPVDSVATARSWYSTRAKEGTGHRSRKASPSSLAAAAALLDKAKPPAPGPVPEEESPESAIWRARESERMAYDQLASAVRAAEESGKLAAAPDATEEQRARHDSDLALLPGLLRTHGQAVRNRLDSERGWERHRQRLGLLVPFDVAQQVVDARLAPLDSQLRNFAKMVAPSANPQAPAIAEAAIESGLRTIFEQISVARQPAAQQAVSTSA